MDISKLPQKVILLDKTNDKIQAVDDIEDINDGYHSFNELYEYRKLYNAAFFNELAKKGNIRVIKSHKHSTGEECFGGGWFIVMAKLPIVGQISNHYEDKDWDLFHVPEVEVCDEWDGHTPREAARRLEEYIRLNQDKH